MMCPRRFYCFTVPAHSFVLHLHFAFLFWREHILEVVRNRRLSLLNRHYFWLAWRVELNLFLKRIRFLLIKKYLCILKVVLVDLLRFTFKVNQALFWNGLFLCFRCLMRLCIRSSYLWIFKISYHNLLFEYYFVWNGQLIILVSVVFWNKPRLDAHCRKVTPHHQEADHFVKEQFY